MSETTEWTSFDASAQVRTKGFEIDGSNDPKRGFKGWAKPVNNGMPKNWRVKWSDYSVFTGATAADMPQ